MQWSGTGNVRVGFEQIGNPAQWTATICNKDAQPWDVTIEVKGSNVKFPQGKQITKRVMPCKQLPLGVVLEVDEPSRFSRVSKRFSCKPCKPRNFGDPHSDGKWIDPAFPPNKSSLGPLHHLPAHVSWVRASEIGMSGQHLFDDIEPNDIKQGRLGDCWLMGAIAAVAEFPGAILKLFKQTQLASDGCYTVYLYNSKKRTWESILIDDCIPCHHGEPLFAHPQNKEMWVLLLEKAFAKMSGSYAKLNGGQMSVALQALCGVSQIDGFMHYNGHWRQTDNSDGWIRIKEVVAFNKLFDWLRYDDNQDYVMTCGIADYGSYSSKLQNGSCHLARPKDLRGARERGLVTGHAYSLIKVLNVHGYKLMQLRNPWGHGEWNGHWSDNSPLWQQNPAVAEAVGFESAVDGSFYMSFEDFVKYFNHIDVCPKTMSSWNLPWSTAATVLRKRRVRKSVMYKLPSRNGKSVSFAQEVRSLCTCAKRRSTGSKRRLAPNANRKKRGMHH